MEKEKEGRDGETKEEREREKNKLFDFKWGPIPGYGIHKHNLFINLLIRLFID